MKQVLFFEGVGDDLENEVNKSLKEMQTNYPSFNVFEICQSAVHNVEFGLHEGLAQYDFPFYVVISVWYEMEKSDFIKLQKRWEE